MNKIVLIFLSVLVGQSSWGQQWGDYTLYSVQNSSSATLLDTNGTAYHTWTFASNKKTGYSSYLLPGGNIIRSIANSGNQLNGGGMTGAIQTCDWNGNVVWDFVYSSSSYCLHHDFCPLPNGNVLLISYDVKSAADITAAGSSIAHSMWLEKIIEVHPTGASTGDIVWEWHVYDHLCQSVNANGGNYVSSTLEHPELFNINYQNTAQTQDWMHMNGIDYNPEFDQIVFSSHMLNEIYVIDHSTSTAEAASHSGGNSGKGGDLLYRWGNPATYGGTGSATLNVVHDGHFIPAGCPNAGFIVGFNNNGVSNSTSCIDMVDTPANGYGFDITPGATLLPSTYTYRQNCTGHTSNMGNSEQLPNGNMLICIAMSGLIYEIDPSGNTIWSKSVSGTVPQAHRYTACYVAGTTPAAPTVSQNGSVLNSSAGGGYQWYLNGAPIAGATAQSYTPTVSGDYQVAIVEAGSCTSELSNAINVVMTNMSEFEVTRDWSIYPNPVQDVLNLVGANNFNYTIVNATGQRVMQGNQSNRIDVSMLESGLYTIVMKDNQGNVEVKKMIKK
ncbi:MAG: hypothetical protein RL062_278 [Bacteroidota bacterium]